MSTHFGSGGPPLQGVRVIDLTRVLSGPLATMILGDLGAEVIKIEPPGGGDVSRATGPYLRPEISYYFHAINRNKKGIVVDLRAPDGRKVLLDLIQQADVLVENYRPGVMARLGLGPDRLLAANPNLIICAISGFGQDGPSAPKGSFDIVTQAMSGAMSLTGEPGWPPVRLGLPLGDQAGGLFAVIGILAALYRRQITGRGYVLDISLLDALVSLLGYLPGVYLTTGRDPEPVGTSHPTVYPYGAFHAKDGWIVLALFNTEFWQQFCKVAGRPELAQDLRFLRTKDRSHNRAELKPIVDAIIAERTVQQWTELLDAAGVPSGPILTVSQVLALPQIRHRNMVIRQPLPGGGETGFIASPLQHTSVGPIPMTPAPALGEHTRVVLEGILGYSPADVDGLLEHGVIQCPVPASEPVSEKECQKGGQCQ